MVGGSSASHSTSVRVTSPCGSQTACVARWILCLPASPPRRVPCIHGGSLRGEASCLHDAAGEPESRQGPRRHVAADRTWSGCYGSVAARASRRRSIVTGDTRFHRRCPRLQRDGGRRSGSWRSRSASRSETWTRLSSGCRCSSQAACGNSCRPRRLRGRPDRAPENGGAVGHLATGRHANSGAESRGEPARTRRLAAVAQATSSGIRSFTLDAVGVPPHTEYCGSVRRKRKGVRLPTQ